MNPPNCTLITDKFYHDIHADYGQILNNFINLTKTLSVFTTRSFKTSIMRDARENMKICAMRFVASE